MKKRLTVLVALLAVVAVLGFSAMAQAEIVVGGISNRTAPTSDAGIPHMDGVLYGWKWVNDHGGICGEKVKVVEIECGYDQPRTVAAFKKLVGTYKVPLIHGFGTPDSLACVPFSTRTKTIYMPLSYLMEWNPDFAPYYFVTTSTYSHAGRSAVQLVKKEGGKLALLYNPGGFGENPIADIKDEAKKQGVEIVAEENIGYVPTDAVQQILKFKAAGATHIWMGNTNSAMIVLAKDLKKQGLDAKIIGNVWAGDEAFIEGAGPDAEGHYGMYTTVAYGDMSAPAMADIMACDYKNKNYSHFIRGWAQALMAAEAMNRVCKAGKKITGPNLKEAFETFKDFSPGGLLPPITISKDDHYASMVTPVYTVKNGKWTKFWDNTLDRAKTGWQAVKDTWKPSK
ncbi:MAG: ABC transporter substrate-binding protein [Pseudomonadota bacterium]